MGILADPAGRAEPTGDQRMHDHRVADLNVADRAAHGADPSSRNTAGCTLRAANAVRKCDFHLVRKLVSPAQASVGTPVYAAVVRSAAAVATAGSVPASMLASRQRRLLDVMNSRPSSDVVQAMITAGSFDSPDARCRARPSTIPSQPTPIAPGPYSAHFSSSTLAVCSRVNRVPPVGAGESRTSIQLTSPPNSQVAPKPVGASQRSTVPPALPCNW